MRSLPRSPKIQRLVTPERLQRRRHLRSLKKRKTEQQKVQVAEYKCVASLRVVVCCQTLTLASFLRTVLAKRLAEKKVKVQAAKVKKK